MRVRARSRAALGALGLVCVAAAAVVAAWLTVGRQDEAREAQGLLLAFAPEEVKAFTLTARGETSRVVRAGDGWRLEAPVAAEADPVVVESLLRAAGNLRRKSTVSDGAGRDVDARYGLAAPRARLEVELDGGRTASLALGDDNPFDGSVYATAGGGSGGVHVVDGGVRFQLERGSDDLRSMRGEASPAPAGTASDPVQGEAPEAPAPTEGQASPGAEEAAEVDPGGPRP